MTIETIHPPAAHWIIIPWLNNPEMTAGALRDALAQEFRCYCAACGYAPETQPNVDHSYPGTSRVLLISSGVSPSDRAWMEGELSDCGDRVLVWWHSPQLPSLSAKWNAGLRFVWATGATEAMVINADLRMRSDTYERLRDTLLTEKALFVSGVGVTEEQYLGTGAMANDARGGPDFSCYVISQECHQRYLFDENYVPAYLEDNDTHRKIMLAGEGDRIFSIDLPYWHIDRGSGTLKSMGEEQRAVVEAQISQGSRAYHRVKWGGDCNEEQWMTPFNEHPYYEVCDDGPPVLVPDSKRGPTSTRALFDAVREGWRAAGK